MRKLMITLAALLCMSAAAAAETTTGITVTHRAATEGAPRDHHNTHADLTALMQRVYGLSADQVARLESVNHEMQEARKTLFAGFRKKADGATEKKTARLARRLDRKMEGLMNDYTAHLRNILTDSQYRHYVMDYQKHEAIRYSRMAQRANGAA